MRRVVMMSGGVGSWAAARRVVEAHGTDGMILLFCDTLIEDDDTYRFLSDAVVDLGVELTRISDGRTPWKVFRDERFLGNHRVDPCSKILKRELADRWLVDNCDPADTTCYVGIDWSEEHRFSPLRDRRAENGWRYEAPLCDPPLLSKGEMLAWARSRGLRTSRAYDQGFSHDNCGGRCVKAGIGHFVRLWAHRRPAFLETESEEQGIRDYLGRDDVAILTDRRGGGRVPMTLAQLRARLEAGEQIPMNREVGGCGCFGGPVE